MAHKLQFGRAVEKDKKKTPRTLDRGGITLLFSTPQHLLTSLFCLSAAFLRALWQVIVVEGRLVRHFITGHHRSAPSSGTCLCPGLAASCTLHRVVCP